MSTNPVDPVAVAIIGGGIGGLTTAVALHQAGIDVHVYEQAAEYRDVGGHLTMDTAAIEVLARWGLDVPFNRVACELAGMEIKDLETGKVIVTMPFPDLGALGVKDDKRMGTRVCHAFLRSDYLKLLTDRLPADRLHTGHKLTALSGDAQQATATFENGAQVKASVMLLADGVRSMARAMFDNAPAVPAGHTVLRTLCSAELLPADMPNDRMRFWDGWRFGDKPNNVGVHALTVPVRDRRFVSIDLQFMGGDQLEDCNPWDLPYARVMQRYPAELDPLLKKMLDARLEPITAHALWDRPVATQWVDQRIAIMGDAAHSMRPNLGQGACQSIHDAGELVAQFARHGLGHEALKAYEAVRMPYTQSIVEAAKNLVVDPKAWKNKAH